MTIGQKVYWINGWPNNGCGRLIFGISLLKLFVCLTSKGRLVFAEDALALKAAIEEKERWMAYCKENGGPREGYDLSDEIIQMKKYYA